VLPLHTLLAFLHEKV